VGEKATLATQRVLRALRESGRTRSLLIGASMRGPEQVAALAGLDVFTMPPKVAAQYEAHPAVHLSAQIENDPLVEWATGVSFADFNATTLWDVPDDFIQAVDRLIENDVEALTPSGIQAHFTEAGIRGFLPTWSEQDIRTITADGKIPVHKTWQEKLAAGEIGLDALMNVSAFQSFASDQRALDDRIRSLI
jgi:transaldolase